MFYWKLLCLYSSRTLTHLQFMLYPYLVLVSEWCWIQRFGGTEQYVHLLFNYTCWKTKKNCFPANSNQCDMEFLSSYNMYLSWWLRMLMLLKYELLICIFFFWELYIQCSTHFFNWVIFLVTKELFNFTRSYLSIVTLSTCPPSWSVLSTFFPQQF